MIFITNAGVPQCFVLALTLFLVYITVFPDYIICNMAIEADNSTLYSLIIKELFSLAWSPFY